MVSILHKMVLSYSDVGWTVLSHFCSPLLKFLRIDVLLRIILTLFAYSGCLSEAATSDMDKTKGGLRRINSMSEFSDHKELMSRLSDDNLDKIINHNCPVDYGIDIRMLCWLKKNTTEQVWVIGGGSILEGDSSYLRVNRGGLFHGPVEERGVLSCRRGTFFTDAKAWKSGIVVVGGEGQESMGSLELYNPIKDTWCALPNMPAKLQYGGSAVTEKNLYLTGGLDHTSGGCSNAVYCLSHGQHAEFVWSELKMRLPEGRFGHAALTVNNGTELWLAGGQNIQALGERRSGQEAEEEDMGDVYQATASVVVYDFEDKVWVAAPPMTVMRVWHRLFEIRGVIYAVGGDSNAFGKALLPTIEKFDRCAARWVHVCDFPSVRRVYSCAVFGDDIVVVGGRGGDYDTCRGTDVFNTVTGLWDTDGLETGKTATRDFLDRFDRDSFIGGAIVVQPVVPRVWTHMK